jgi:hypothetical protein
MGVNSNPTASQQNKKKLPVSKFFPLIADVVDTSDNLYFRTTVLKNLKWPQWDTWGPGETDSSKKQKSLKSKISCQTPVKS